MIQNLLIDLNSITCTDTLQKTLNTIDNIIGLIITNVDNHFQRKPALVAWSPLYKEKILLQHQAQHHLYQYVKYNNLLPPIPAHIPTEQSALIKYLKNLLYSATKELKAVEK